MVAHIRSFAFRGIDVTEVDVQVHMASGLPAFTVVGLADKAVTESRERVRAALSSLGLSLPPQRITVNLAPADIAKEGSHYDLAIALGLLAAMQVVPEEELSSYIVMGELALDGSLAPVTGVLPAAIGANSRNLGIICPEINGLEACWAGNLDVLAPPSLLALINHFKGTQVLCRPENTETLPAQPYPDMKDIRGQETARRALELSAAGGHNILMSGPPGAGKSMLAARLAGIMPPLDAEEMLNISMIHSIAGTLETGGLSRHRPFRSPHHSCSMAAMVGGGAKARPGEITLAHGGILFLDELPEFSRQVLDSLRQPVESGTVTVARAQSHITYPADFQLIAAMNPCRCGYLDDAARACNKAPKCAADYQSKLSGPLLDRIDIHVYVPAVSPVELMSQTAAEPSAAVLERVMAAREIQKARYRQQPFSINARADGEVLLDICRISEEGKNLLLSAVEKMGLSMRGHNRILRVARTIADLEGVQDVHPHHLAEALSFREMQYRHLPRHAASA